MNNLDLTLLEKEAQEAQLPYKLVAPAEIKLGGRLFNDDIIEVNGTKMLATRKAITSLDDYYGITARQKDNVSKSKGDSGMSSLRNYLGAAASMANPGKKIALFADPDTKKVVDAVPVVDTIISPRQFFNLAEIVISKYDLVPSQYFGDPSERGKFTLILKSRESNILTFAPDEDFDCGSCFLEWDLGSVSCGIMVIRKVCTNGQIARVPRNMGTIHNLSTESVNRFLEVLKKILTPATSTPILLFKKKALSAMTTRASLCEMASVYEALTDDFGISELEAQRIAPIDANEKAYSKMGYVDLDLKNTLSNMNVWGLYNNMTEYASHTQSWGPHDGKRTQLMETALGFLNGPRDIKPQLDIFGPIQ